MKRLQLPNCRAQTKCLPISCAQSSIPGQLKKVSVWLHLHFTSQLVHFFSRFTVVSKTCKDTTVIDDVLLSLYQRPCTTLVTMTEKGSCTRTLFNLYPIEKVYGYTCTVHQHSFHYKTNTEFNLQER